MIRRPFVCAHIRISLKCLYFYVFLSVLIYIVSVHGLIKADVFSTGLDNKSSEKFKIDTAGKDLNSEENGIQLPIIMYHALIDIKKYQNEYFIDPKLFEADLKYLKDNGYTSVDIEDLVSYVEGTKALPEKPVMLTFDDGYYNNYLYAYPLLRQYGMKAVISPVGKLSDDFSKINDTNEYYAYLTWDHLREMQVSEFFEVQNHTYNMHAIDKQRKGAMQANGESPEAYKSTLEKDLMLFQSRAHEMLGVTPTALVYPYGAYNKASEEVAKSLGFKATLTCTEGMNYITRDSESLYSLKRFLRDSKTGVSDILKK